MRHFVGLNDFALRRRSERLPVYYDPRELINGHLLVCGMSGSGKSYQCRRLLQSAAQAGLEVDAFDVHDELGALPEAGTCLFSQATGYGYNPLILDPDPHTGGPLRQADFLVGLVREVTPQFGIKQEAALRNLLTDLYSARGIYQDKPGTWTRNLLSEQEAQILSAARDWDALRRSYPSLSDLLSYAQRKVIALTLGGNNPAVTAFDQFCKAKARVLRATRTSEVDTAQLERIKAQCIDAYAAFVEGLQTGRELEDLVRYDSREVLTSVVQRLSILADAGIFRPNTPPFGDNRFRVYQLKALTPDQQVLFVKLRLRAIFDRRKREPLPSGLRQVIFLDEAHKFFSSREDDIINVIAKEARKFGIGLWCSSQSPVGFPESFLTNVGATCLLGIHAAYWKRSSSMLRVDEEALKWIKPKEVLSIKLQRFGQADPPFTNVVVPNVNSHFGRMAAEAAA